MATFERILWRVLRGNLYMNYAEIAEPFHDPSKEEPIRKNVFIIFAHGSELLSKIRKISESMGGTLYPIDSNADKREESLREVTNRIEDLNNVLYSTSATRRTELVKIAETLSAWADVVRKEKMIYGTMNLFKFEASRKTLIAEGWCPSSGIGALHLALQRASENVGTSVIPVLEELKTSEMPPTYHLTNKFTMGFQSIIDAYGFASYQEVNPGLFTVITFPFLFAVMFGDIGHGILMFLAALTMCVYERKLAKANLGEIFDMFFVGRYIILLMGIFSMFTGLMYNDVFSKSMHLFATGWEWPTDTNSTSLTAVKLDRVYAIGLDPTWHGASNALVFTNSLKMKMSIILGVLHMSFALCLNIPNAIHYKKPVNIYGEFIPKMLLLQALFGYLVFTIVYKWSIDWYEQDANGVVFRNNPPGLLNMLIYMFLSPGSVAKEKELYPFQGVVQSLLLLVAFICVPWMLCVKPYVEWKEHKARGGQGYQSVTNEGAARESTDHRDSRDDEDGEGHVVNGQANGHGQEEHEEFEIGEVVIHSVIETIEFVLGTVSQTASYLRLWALSLAHAQLSEVAWSMTINNVFKMTGVVGVLATVAAFAVWFVLSIAVLVIMEGLSAFLHALRLHWVEASSKHYIANGYPFQPLSFKEEEM
jgi:V-type H+-transporting ATPase subunit a